jgi:REP-associated tyrosine transposase
MRTPPPRAGRLRRPDVWKGSPFRKRICLILWRLGRCLATECHIRIFFAPMFRISRNNPAYYLTLVARDRLQIFRTDAIKAVACRGLDEARRSGEFRIFAYVLMPDHFHLITSGNLPIAETLRYANGITGRRIIGYLKERGHESSLRKLERQSGARGHKYSLWDHHSNAMSLIGESIFIQKVNYTHLNPVRLGLVEQTVDYPRSSARQWRGMESNESGLEVDLSEIEWRRT